MILVVYLALMVSCLYVKFCGDAKCHQGTLVQSLNRFMVNTVPARLKYVLASLIASFFGGGATEKDRGGCSDGCRFCWAGGG